MTAVARGLVPLVLAFVASGASAVQAPNRTAVLLAAGDIASCQSSGDEATARLVAARRGVVAALGDNVYQGGTADEYARCYAPTWGRFKARTRPAPGNHEYVTPGAAGYFAYFGRRAGATDKGYYSYDLGAWHVVVLNSNCGDVGGCETDSPQGRWLRADLASHRRACTLAYWHHPRFSSSLHGSDVRFESFWQLLYAAHADVVLTGHDHDYERFAPQTPAGRLDPRRGIVEFVVGTGGKSHYLIGRPVANSRAHNDDTFGILQLTLRARGYSWKFVPVAGRRFTDAGAARCVA